jgi:hypothetical protein
MSSGEHWFLIFESAPRALVSKVCVIVTGIGRGAAQVLYHQQQRSVPGRMQQSPGPNTPQHGYNTQQPIQTVSAGYSTQQNTPAYTTQAQSQQPSSGGSAPQGYSSQQVCRYGTHNRFNAVTVLLQFPEVVQNYDW